MENRFPNAPNDSAIAKPPIAADASIVHGGDWREEKRRYQPRAQLFRTLSVLWIFPSLGALCIWIAGGDGRMRAEGWAAKLQAVTFEQWIAALVLLAQPTFVWLAIRYRRTEKFKEVTVQIPNRTYDPNKLY